MEVYLKGEIKLVKNSATIQMHINRTLINVSDILGECF